MNATRLLVTAAITAGAALTGCHTPGRSAAPALTLPANTVVVVQQLAADCTAALEPLRTYMAARTVRLDDAAKDTIQTLAAPAYDRCTPADWQAFEDNELLPWARRLPAGRDPDPDGGQVTPSAG